MCEEFSCTRQRFFVSLSISKGSFLSLYSMIYLTRDTLIRDLDQNVYDGNEK